MQSLNEWLFLMINGSETSPAVAVAVALGLASYVVPLVAVGLVIGWVRGSSGVRHELVSAALSGLLGLLVVQCIAFAWYVPRPFQVGLGTQLMPHVPEASFPSDHATLMFSVAFAVILSRGVRGWGLILFALAIAVSWARVFLGVHFPFDMLGGLAVGAFSAAFVGRGLSSAVGSLTRQVEVVYERTLLFTYLPSSLFPRR